MVMEMKLILSQLFGYSHDHITTQDRNQNSSNGYQIKIMLKKEEYPSGFQVPLHYPKYSKTDYEAMDHLSLDLILKQYGLSFQGSLHDKRAFAVESFLWPHQL